jgi:hypothetical protein
MNRLVRLANKSLSHIAASKFPNPITHFPRPRLAYPTRAARAYNARHEGVCSFPHCHAPHSGGGARTSFAAAKSVRRGYPPGLRREQLSCRTKRKPRSQQAKSELGQKPQESWCAARQQERLQARGLRRRESRPLCRDPRALQAAALAGRRRHRNSGCTRRHRRASRAHPRGRQARNDVARRSG